MTSETGQTVQASQDEAVRQSDGEARGRTSNLGFAVIAVICLGLLGAAMLIMAMGRTSEPWRTDRGMGTRTQVATLGHQLEMYNLNIGHYPTEAEGGLKALLVKPNYADPLMNSNWAGPYVNADQLKDSWGTDMHYELSAAGENSTVPFKLWSSGPDRVDGTEDDIRNWSDGSGEPE